MKPETAPAPLGIFERYLTLWVALAMALGVVLGALLPTPMGYLARMEIAKVNIPVGILIFAMIYPMMLKIDFGSIGQAGQFTRGMLLTLAVNWLIKPFTMAYIAIFFFREVFGDYITPGRQDEFIAGAILLGAAPCTAMVFVWSYLTKGNSTYTLIQVGINDLVLLIAFIPIVQFLLGVTGLAIPYDVLLVSVGLYVALPLALGILSWQVLMRRKGREWYEHTFLPMFRPVTIVALLLTLVLLFAFQGDALLNHPLEIAFIAVPLALQTYLIFFTGWVGGRWLHLPHPICAPSALIGASNFFELAVAVAITLFGMHSGAALVTVVGVLIEVPIMLSLVALANRWRY